MFAYLNLCSHWFCFAFSFLSLTATKTSMSDFFLHRFAMLQKVPTRNERCQGAFQTHLEPIFLAKIIILLKEPMLP